MRRTTHLPLVMVATALVLYLLLPMPAYAEHAAEPLAEPTLPAELLAQAEAIHRRIITLDTHVDIAGPQYATDKLDPGVDHPGLQCDLVKMAAGGVDGVFLAVFVPQGTCDEQGYLKARRAAEGKFEAIHRLAKRYPERCAIATSPEEVRQVVGNGKHAVMIGVENGYPIGEDLTQLGQFYRRGARYVTLCHNGHNQICDSCNPRKQLGDRPRKYHGLSPFGEQVVAEMNRLGMMIDVSHLAPESFWDVVKLSKAPIIASHSGCRALCDHPRNLDDAQLKALAAHGGVIQVVAVGSFLKRPSAQRTEALRELALQLGIPWKEGSADLRAADDAQKRRYREGVEQIDRSFPPPSLADYVDHIEHAVQVAGIDHVGIGSDFDGGGGVQGFNHHGQALQVTAELLRRGYSEEQIEKIWSGNLLRVWTAVESVAKRMQKNPS